MHGSIQLYDQFVLMAIEVSNERSNGMLSTKLQLIKPPTTHNFPEELFSISLLLPQSTTILKPLIRGHKVHG